MMTPHDAQKLLENPDVLKWLAEGKLEVKHKAEIKWLTVTDCGFNMREFEYRRKPEPERRVLMVRPDNTCFFAPESSIEIFKRKGLDVWDAIKRI